MDYFQDNRNTTICFI